jgi:hypothetical protein
MYQSFSPLPLSAVTLAATLVVELRGLARSCDSCDSESCYSQESVSLGWLAYPVFEVFSSSEKVHVVLKLNLKML